MPTPMNDDDLILEIAKRAHAILSKHGSDILAKNGEDCRIIDIYMNVHACHLSIPLRLEDLLKADDFNMMHDIIGIARHLDEDTRQVIGNFLPRFAKKP